MRRPDLHGLRADQAQYGQGRGMPELRGQRENALEVGPCRKLLSVLTNSARPIASRVRVVLLLVATGAQVEVTSAAPICHVMRALHALVADVALVAFQADREEQRVHVDVRDELALLLRALGEVLAQHEVLHVDAEHDDAEQAALPHLTLVDALEAVVHGHRGRDRKVRRHDDRLTTVRLFHQLGVAPLRLLDGDRWRGVGCHAQHPAAPRGVAQGRTEVVPVAGGAIRARWRLGVLRLQAPEVGGGGRGVVPIVGHTGEQWQQQKAQGKTDQDIPSRAIEPPMAEEESAEARCDVKEKHRDNGHHERAL
mmetsp:Transcript_30738/g.88756  ORF Transcript_30738/g.88756 Transcript_30738/m.88756 type:complete len:310 (+) Transcript_30738:1873-2802(+)